MGRKLILTFMADDQPGLVERLSEVVTERGGNWLESRMAHLAEKFAGIAKVDIPNDEVEVFRSALAALEAQGFRLTVEEAEIDTPPGGVVLHVDLVGPDHPGIVHDISHCLVVHGVSIEEMETDVREAPMGGGPHFYAQVYVRAPADIDQVKLRQDIELLSAALMVEITIQEEISGPDR